MGGIVNIYYMTKESLSPPPLQLSVREQIVYFIREEGRNRVKIGDTSMDVEDRLKTLQTGNSDELVVLGTTIEYTESEIHSMFEDYRIRGEWFHLTTEIIDFIRKKVRMEVSDEELELVLRIKDGTGIEVIE